jgi:hypothetical protein
MSKVLYHRIDRLTAASQSGPPSCSITKILGGGMTQKGKLTQNFCLKIWKEENVTASHRWPDNIEIDRREAKRNSIMWLWVGTNRQALVSEVIKLKMERFFVACISNVTVVHAVSYQHHQHRRGAYSSVTTTATDVLYVPRQYVCNKATQHFSSSTTTSNWDTAQL